jgi:hypothetical protein
MLAKCANQKCIAQLRYLHEGRMFVVWPRKPMIIATSRIEYVWLCAACNSAPPRIERFSR